MLEFIHFSILKLWMIYMFVEATSVHWRVFSVTLECLHSCDGYLANLSPCEFNVEEFSWEIIFTWTYSENIHEQTSIVFLVLRQISVITLQSSSVENINVINFDLGSNSGSEFNVMQRPSECGIALYPIIRQWAISRAIL